VVGNRTSAYNIAFDGHPVGGTDAQFQHSVGQQYAIACFDNSGLSGDSIQRVVQPTVTEDGEKAPSLKFGQPRVMALLLALTLFQHLIDGFHNRDLRSLVTDLLGVTIAQYTAGQMTYDLRRLRLKGLIFRPPRTNRYFITP